MEENELAGISFSSYAAIAIGGGMAAAELFIDNIPYDA
jgi:hypothetical protein